jgi:hypothetical protein
MNAKEVLKYLLDKLNSERYRSFGIEYSPVEDSVGGEHFNIYKRFTDTKGDYGMFYPTEIKIISEILRGTGFRVVGITCMYEELSIQISRRSSL